jgi:DNA-binding MarR family transcriptional regulator
VTEQPDPVDPVRAVRALARVSRVLERAGGELNLAHYRVLSAVASGDERASRIAARLALGKPAVSAAVDALTQRGLLVRTGLDPDQRVATLSLTPAGEVVLERFQAAMVERIDDLCARTPDPAVVMRALVWLDGALDAALADRRAGNDAEPSPDRAVVDAGGR